MAGYDDTYNMIISTLMGRPAGTEIQPENHQAFALNMLEYIRSLELLANAPFIGVATPTTQPVQPDDSRACYIAGVAQDRTTIFQNFRDMNGNPLIAGTAAQVPANAIDDLLPGGVRIFVEQRRGGHEEAWRAEPALERTVLDEALLQRRQIRAIGQALHRGDMHPIQLRCQHQAGVDG